MDCNYKKAEYNRGASDMKNKLVIPLLLAGVGMSSLATIGYPKILKWIAEKNMSLFLRSKKL